VQDTSWDGRAYTDPGNNQCCVVRKAIAENPEQLGKAKIPESSRPLLAYLQILFKKEIM
jgi:hypothetical protein